MTEYQATAKVLPSVPVPEAFLLGRASARMELRM